MRYKTDEEITIYNEIKNSFRSIYIVLYRNKIEIEKLKDMNYFFKNLLRNLILQN